ncbi:MAG: hypothetical protein DSO08_05920 [Candidatus Methanomethylicota archaeon]|uniref:Glycosyltransferase 2-like domain-containing protein n=1 Tax=Thermoproteota archaeon TaxID=2056631 RepID=A0A523B8T6_9CREN|nr:MAG: hypothetical protein DSO08_05920 [Candidatus Verstraetearchaeota archaeon]
MAPRIIICIPAYNEESTIAKMVIRAKPYGHVLVCDDGSVDMTKDIAEALGAEVIRHSVNKGKDFALRSLFMRAKEIGFDILVTIDADCQHDPSEIPKLVEPIISGKADVVNGRRLGSPEMPLSRRIGNKFLSLLFKTGVEDAFTGFRAYSRQAIDALKVEGRGYLVDAWIMKELREAKIRIIEVPVSVSYTIEKRGVLAHLSKIINAWISQTVERKPLVYLGIPGAIFFLGSLFAAFRVLMIFQSTKAIAIGTAILFLALLSAGIFMMISALVIVVLKSLLRSRS